MTSDDAKLFRSFQKQQAELAQTGKAYAEAGRKGKVAANSVEGAFRKSNQEHGPNATAAVMKYAASFSAISLGLKGVAKAAQQVGDMYKYWNDQAKQAAERGKDSEAGFGKLVQLAGNEEQLNQYLGQAKQVFADGAAKTMNEAMNMVFDVQSASQGESLQTFIDLGSRGISQNPAALASAAKTIIDAMGADETGSARDISSKGFAASAVAKSTVEEILQASAKPGGSASRLGISDEQVMASIATTSAAAGSASEAGTQIAALLKAVEKQDAFDLKADNLPDIIAKITAAQKQSGKSLFDADLLGRAEAVSGYDFLRRQIESGAFGKAETSIIEAEKTDLTGQKIAMADRSGGAAGTQAIASRQERIQANQRAMEEADLGEARNMGEALIQNIMAEMQRKDAGGIDRFIVEKGLRAKQSILAPDTFLEGMAGSGNLGNDPDLQSRIVGRVTRNQAQEAGMSPEAADKVGRMAEEQVKKLTEINDQLKKSGNQKQLNPRAGMEG
jgi:hypothetical protein